LADTQGPPVGDGQQYLNGIQLTAALGGTSHVYSFTANLPATAGHTTSNSKLLVATQSFANLGILTPDYIVPDKFLFIPLGTLNYGNVDLVSYPALPTDGSHALDHSGNAVLATPTNFNGNSAVVNVAPPTPLGPYDIDANGQVDALTDGLMLIRYLFGLRGASLIQGAIGPSAARNTAAAIEAYIATQVPP